MRRLLLLIPALLCLGAITPGSELGRGVHYSDLGAGATSGVESVAPVFQLDAMASGSFIGGQDPGTSLTVGGQSLTLELGYKASDANGSTWTDEAGNFDLAVTGTMGSDSYAPAGLGDAVSGMSGTNYYLLNSAGPNLAGKDFCFEALARAGATGYLASFGGTHKVSLLCASTDCRWNINISGAAGNYDMTSLSTIAEGDWSYHFGCVNNSITHCAGRANRTDTAGTDNDCAGADLSDGPIWLGRGAGVPTGQAGLLLVRAWSCTDCLSDTTATMASDVADAQSERFQKLTGTWPTYASTSLATTLSRASSATGPVYDGTDTVRVIRYAPGWPRLASWGPTWGSASGATYGGLIVEEARTNENSNSADISTGHTLVRALAVTDTATAPDGTTTADTLDSDGTASNTARLRYTGTGTAATPYVFSVFVKAPASNPQSITHVNIIDGDNSSAEAFALSDCQPTGTRFTGSAATAAGGDDYGDGWCRIWISDTSDGTGAAYDVIPCTSDTACNLSPTVNDDLLYVWGLQYEDGPSEPSMYIPTSGATATRSADTLTWPLTAPAAAVTLVADVLTQDHDSPGVVLAEVGDGTDDNRVRLSITSGDVAECLVVSGAVTQATVTGTTDVADGTSHEVRCVAAANSVTLYVDGTSEGTPDTSATFPAGMDEVHVGDEASATTEANGLLGVTVYAAQVTP